MYASLIHRKPPFFPSSNSLCDFSSEFKREFLNVIKPFLCHVFNERLFLYGEHHHHLRFFNTKKQKIVDLISAALKRCNPMTRALTMKWLSILK
jgi:hypothetical protein